MIAKTASVNAPHVSVLAEWVIASVHVRCVPGIIWKGISVVYPHPLVLNFAIHIFRIPLVNSYNGIVTYNQ